MQGLLSKCIACISAAALSLVITGCDTSSSNSSSSSSSGAVSSSGSNGSGFVRSNVQVHFPPVISTTSKDTITIRGSVADAANISQIFVNDMLASSSDNFATWSLALELSEGSNSLAVTSANAAGEVTAVSTLTVAKETPFISPKGVILDEANNQILVLDPAQNAIIKVDSNTGTRQIFSSGNLLQQPLKLILDSAGNQVIVYQNSETRFVSVALTDGSQTALTEPENPEFASAISAITMGDNNDLLVAGTQLVEVPDPDDASEVVTVGRTAIYSFDLASGGKTIVSSNNLPDTGTLFGNIVTLTNSPGSEQIFIADDLSDGSINIRRLISVNKADGVRTRLLPALKEDNTIDTDKFDFANSGYIEHKPNQNSLWVYNSDSLVKLDLQTLTGQTISESKRPDGQWNFLTSVSTPAGEPFIIFAPNDIAIDANGDTAYIASDTFDHILKVDTATGARTRLTGAGPENIDGTVNFVTPSYLAFDGKNRTLYVSDSLLQSVFAIDVETGNKSAIAAINREQDTNTIFAPLALALSEPADNSAATLFALDNLNRITGSSSAAPRLNAINLETADAQRLVSFGSTAFQLNDLIYTSFNSTAYTAENASILRLRINANNDVDISAVADNRDQPNHRFARLSSILFDPFENRILAADTANNAIYSVNISTGVRTLLTGVGTPSTSDFELSQPTALNLDPLRKRIVLLDSSLQAIVAVDLENGSREKLVSDLGLRNMRDMSYVPELNTAFISDGLSDAIYVVDIETGEQVQFIR